MSFFTTTSTKATNSGKSRRRSSSEVRHGKSSNRFPIISFEESSDVATAVCTEISRLMMLNPDMKTGTFFTAMSNSQLDINKSDATIVISASILSHIGNEKMKDKLLSKSSSCTRLFNELGLDKPRLCEMFVIMQFAMNPTFCTLLSNAIQISLTRAQDFIKDNIDEDRLKIAAGGLVKDGSWSKEEALSVIVPNRFESMRLANAESSFTKTPTSMVHPDDSISAVGSIPDYRRRITTKDMMSFVKRKQRGIEPTFSEVFKSESIPRPPLANQNVNRYGIGYAPSEATKANKTLLGEMNNILGSQTTVSYNLATGRGRTRRPRVEDYLESESIATTTLKSPPDAETNPWDVSSFKAPRPPSPTEIHLPNSVIDEILEHPLREIDSYEAIKSKLAAG